MIFAKPVFNTGFFVLGKGTWWRSRALAILTGRKQHSGQFSTAVENLFILTVNLTLTKAIQKLFIFNC
ncbi:hypothetical protein CQ059_10405 [Brucella pseudogrignonensis]|nr:hypothetical protein CQ059_10405 [Brucella pseudogrignonensis]PRA41556.1 hypothetical protein CQ063_05885 [Brucella pseudogrignonensis]PRA71019.1 hypothetical protein CQ055_09115 [Brucella pseudogrignonensis]